MMRVGCEWCTERLMMERNGLLDTSSHVSAYGLVYMSMAAALMSGGFVPSRCWLVSWSTLGIQCELLARIL